MSSAFVEHLVKRSGYPGGRRAPGSVASRLADRTMRSRKKALLLAALMTALGLTGIVHAVTPNIRGRISGQDKLLPEVYGLSLIHI